MMKTRLRYQPLCGVLCAIIALPTSWATDCTPELLNLACNKAKSAFSFIFFTEIRLTLDEDIVVINSNPTDVAAFSTALQTITTGSPGTVGPLRLTAAPLYYYLQPALSSEPASVMRSTGLYLLPHLAAQTQNVYAVYYVYTDQSGQLKQHALLPYPANATALNNALQILGFSPINLNNTGSFVTTSPQGKTYHAIADYSVTPSSHFPNKVEFNTGIGDLNHDGIADIQVTYPNGEQQALLLLP